jgi:phosphatidylinositol alpha 1,6-mannosyltransferase
VQRLAAEPAWRARLGRQAHESVAARSWEALGDELLGHYASVLRRVDATEVAA